MTDIVNLGAAVKKSQYSAVGYLRRNNLGDFGQDTSYEVINDATGNVANTLVRRDSNGDFGARIANFQSLSIDSRIVLDTELLNETNNAGIIKLYSYNGVEGITLGSGNLNSDRKNIYRNDEHVFQTQNGLGAGTINAGTLTTGAAGTSGTITGNWILSNLSTIDTANGTLKSTTLTTGDISTAGTITGSWSLSGNSTLTVGTGSIDARTGILYADTLHAGSGVSAGQVTGQWTIASGSTFVATSVQNQANSATIAASSTNTANNIVQRDGAGNFTAGTITAALNGNASTASTAARWTTARTVTFTGDVTGSFTIDGSADVSNVALTVGSDRVALGTDTTGQYARTITVSGTGISINTASTDDGTDYTITSSATSATTANAIVQRDGFGNFSAGTISANLQGNAATASVASQSSVTNTTANQSYYLLFVDDSATGNRVVRSHAGAVYNPGTNTLSIGVAGSTGSVNANLNGNATTASTAAALNTAGNYQINSLGVGTGASTTAGEIRATNNITAYFSDDRLKTRLGKIENALDKVDQLSGFYYEPNQAAQDLGYEVKREVGVSAQEVERIMPEIVAPAPIDDKYLTVRYEKLAPLLIEAIKELRSEINDIKKKLG